MRKRCDGADVRGSLNPWLLMLKIRAEEPIIEDARTISSRLVVSSLRILISLQLHQPNVAGRLGVFICDLISQRRPRRITDVRVELCVIRQLLLLFGRARNPIDIPRTTTMSCE